jgi:hypothetical protein
MDLVRQKRHRKSMFALGLMLVSRMDTAVFQPLIIGHSKTLVHNKVKSMQGSPAGMAAIVVQYPDSGA